MGARQVSSVKRPSKHATARLGERGGVLVRDAAQHGVRKPRGARGDGSHELDALAHADVGARVEVEELEGGEAQRVAHARLEARAPAQVRVDGAVELTNGCRRAEGETGDQGTVALGKLGELRRAAQQVAHARVATTALRDQREGGEACRGGARH